MSSPNSYQQQQQQQRRQRQQQSDPPDTNDHRQNMSSNKHTTQSLAEALLLELPDMKDVIAMALREIPMPESPPNRSPNNLFSWHQPTIEESVANCWPNDRNQIADATSTEEYTRTLVGTNSGSDFEPTFMDTDNVAKIEPDETEYEHVTGDDSDGMSTATNATMATSMNSETRVEIEADVKQEAQDSKENIRPILLEHTDEEMPCNQPAMMGNDRLPCLKAEIKQEDEIKQENVRREFLVLTSEELARDERHRGSGESFLQHLPCFKLQQEKLEDEPLVPKCRECLVGAGLKTGDVYCRFFEFRRLKYNTNGTLEVTGFPNPYKDPQPADFNIWQPDRNTPPTAGDMDIQTCRYILLHAGDQFCYLWRQEFEAFRMHENPNAVIAWKKMVRGVREICDVCDTTLFNVHWTCDKCGFSVCAECVRDRKENRRCRRFRDTPVQRGRDAMHWLMCTGNVIHRFEQLMLTQIIAGNSLNHLGELMHTIRNVWMIPQMCGCQLSKPGDTKFESLCNYMIREARLEERHKALVSISAEERQRLEQKHSTKIELARRTGVHYVPGESRHTWRLGKDPITSALDEFQHINIQRKGLAGLRRFLPPRSMTLTFSQQMAPTVPHEWLCEGRLLRLLDPLQRDNRSLFQEVWKCGQPVVISEVSRSLNLALWHPQAFCQDFGAKPNDLINCLNGNLVPKQPMRHFWEGFQCIKQRLVDSNGQPMLLKLKDWPPGDDFAEIMPTRFNDLMAGLPMPEYTLRTGHLNIASCLPEMFVPPDLGPKMYNAYGSALHPEKGTTNLHLDISDAVNIMVYVGIPNDEDSKSQLAATQLAIAAGGCDFYTRYRVAQPNALPGALWHIFSARDADKIRDLLNRVILEKGYRLDPDHDPIHDQNWYLDDKLRRRLVTEYGVESFPIVQCQGDAVFIPAGAPHQVQNLHNCIKVAEDFVSPENITHCYHLTHEFRRLSHSHTNHEDKLQIKNIIYHAIKDCCTILQRKFETRIAEEIARQNTETSTTAKRPRIDE